MFDDRNHDVLNFIIISFGCKILSGLDLYIGIEIIIKSIFIGVT